MRIVVLLSDQYVYAQLSSILEHSFLSFDKLFLHDPEKLLSNKLKRVFPITEYDTINKTNKSEMSVIQIKEPVVVKKLSSLFTILEKGGSFETEELVGHTDVKTDKSYELTDNDITFFDTEPVDQENLNFLHNYLNRIETTFVVMGNGPSLSTLDFRLIEDYTTIGLNAAYRIYDKINFYPTYFGCFDSIVCNSHKKQYEKMIKDPKNPIKKWFLIDKMYDRKPIFDKSVRSNKKVPFLNFVFKSEKTKTNPNLLSQSFDMFIDMLNSGANAVQVGYLLGYKRFILVGCDCNYVEVVDGAKEDGNYLRMYATPDHNPNYWFSDYQQEGDRYNKPNSLKYQFKGWYNVYIQ